MPAASRRIVPALAVLLLAVIAAAALFAANVYFFSDVGYFQTEADVKPLLHT